MTTRPPNIAKVLLASLLAVLAACSSNKPGSDAPPPPPGGVAEDGPAVDGGQEATPPQDQAAPVEPAAAPTGQATTETSVPPTRSPVAPEDVSSYDIIDRTFDFAIGGAVLTGFDTTLQVNGPNGNAGGRLDLENLFGLQGSSTVIRLDTTFSFNDKHSIMLSYYDIGRSGTSQLNEEVDVGTVTIPATSVTTSVGTTIIKLAYRFDFVRDTRTKIGASLGLDYMGMDFSIAAGGGVNASESFSADLPLPVFGLHGQYALGHKWELYGSIEFLEVGIGGVSGFLRDSRVGINHAPFKHFGWGAAYQAFSIDADFDTSNDLTASLDYGFRGLMLYLRTFF